MKVLRPQWVSLFLKIVWFCSKGEMAWYVRLSCSCARIYSPLILMVVGICFYYKCMELPGWMSISFGFYEFVKSI